MFGIYKIENLINGKVYIGQSKDIHTRWKQHIYTLNNNEHISSVLQKEWWEYGNDNFVFDILYEVKREMTDNVINGIEQYFIEKHDSINTGYNTKEVIKLNKKAKSRIEKIVSRSYYDNFIISLNTLESTFGKIIQYDKHLTKLIENKDTKTNVYSTYGKIIEFVNMNLKYLPSEKSTRITFRRISRNIMCIGFEYDECNYDFYRVKQNEYRIDRLDKINNTLTCIYKYNNSI